MRSGTRFVLALLCLVPAGCASVDWTQGLFAKRQVEVEDRFAKVESDVQMHDQRIERVEGRVTELDSRLTETRELVRRTPSPAAVPVVVARPTLPEVRPPGPEPVLGPVRTLVAVVHVPFGFDRSDLDSGAEAALAGVLKELRDNPALTIDLEGFTDPSGRLEYNVRLSQRRVDTVRRWLVGHGLDRARIVAATARGPLTTANGKDDVKRRVMVKLMGAGQ
jgi:outer membrane protein OmpA-like peptidoglycan-associated protein